jgi:hypothetical protein
MKNLLPILLLPLLLAPREASAQYADPCAGVQCPAHSSCMVTTMGVVCGCDPGFTPTSAGCQLTRCSSSKQCEEGEGCLSGKCVPRETIDASIQKSRKVGIGLLVPGIILTATGAAFVAVGAVMFEKSRSCGYVLGIRVCDHDESSLEYRMYRGFMWSGIVTFGAGLAMLIVGAVKLGRAKRLEIYSRLELTPFISPIPGGGMAGLTARF